MRRLLAWLPVLLVLALAASRAAADFAIGGDVPGLIAINIGDPGAFRAAGGRGTYEMRVPVSVTSSVDHVYLSVADGDNFTGPAHGHLISGGKPVKAPLEAFAGHGAAQALDAPLDLRLASWSQPLSLQPVTVVLEQRLAEIVLEKRREEWLASNREAMEDANRYVERHGVFSDGLRKF